MQLYTVLLSIEQQRLVGRLC